MGKASILKLIRAQRFQLKGALLASVPVVFAAIGRFQFGMEYEKAATCAAVGLLATALGNGFFEEVLWRGTSTQLFPTAPCFALSGPVCGSGVALCPRFGRR